MHHGTSLDRTNEKAGSVNIYLTGYLLGYHCCLNPLILKYTILISVIPIHGTSDMNEMEASHSAARAPILNLPLDPLHENLYLICTCSLFSRKNRNLETVGNSPQCSFTQCHRETHGTLRELWRS